LSAAAAGWATTTREPRTRTRTRTRTPRLAREASLLQLLSTLHLAPVRRARAFPTQVCVDTAPAAAPAACAGEPLPAAPHCGLQALQTTKKKSITLSSEGRPGRGTVCGRGLLAEIRGRPTATTRRTWMATGADPIPHHTHILAICVPARSDCLPASPPTHAPRPHTQTGPPCASSVFFFTFLKYTSLHETCTSLHETCTSLQCTSLHETHFPSAAVVSLPLLKCAPASAAAMCAESFSDLETAVFMSP